MARTSAAGAGRARAARAAALVLLARGGLQVDARDRGERREPGEHVGELALELALLAAPQRARQLADLLAEPHVRPSQAARGVAREVDLLDAALEVLDAHGLSRRVPRERDERDVLLEAGLPGVLLEVALEGAQELGGVE